MMVAMIVHNMWKWLRTISPTLIKDPPEDKGGEGGGDDVVGHTEEANLAKPSKELGFAEVVGVVQDHWANLDRMLMARVMMRKVTRMEEMTFAGSWVDAAASPGTIWSERTPRMKPRLQKMAAEGTNRLQGFIHLLSLKNIPLDRDDVKVLKLNCLPSR